MPLKHMEMLSLSSARRQPSEAMFCDGFTGSFISPLFVENAHQGRNIPCGA